MLRYFQITKPKYFKTKCFFYIKMNNKSNCVQVSVLMKYEAEKY